MLNVSVNLFIIQFVTIVNVNLTQFSVTYDS